MLMDIVKTKDVIKDSQTKVVSCLLSVTIRGVKVFFLGGVITPLPPPPLTSMVTILNILVSSHAGWFYVVAWRQLKTEVLPSPQEVINRHHLTVRE